MSNKPKVYLTSNVFSAEEIGSNEKISENIRKIIRNLWEELTNISELKIFDGRFPSEEQLRDELESFKPDILGCHLSHPIPAELLENSNIFAISTSTAGYNHIQKTFNDDILITHTPGVLHETVADYTIAIIMANLRNIVDLHNYVWNEKWIPEDKWDLDQSLSNVITNKTLGIVGLGEIGKELVKRFYPWDIKILYYDIKRAEDFEKRYPKLNFRAKLEDVFKEADIVSLHIPLNKYTEKIINSDLLKLMKKGALLVNTARGPILDMDALLELLENREIKINLAIDVFPIEPIDAESLKRLKKIKEKQPDIRMVLIPHNASADADTRGKMDIIFLEDIIGIIESNRAEDLGKIRLIPEHRKQIREKGWRIHKYWERK